MLRSAEAEETIKEILKIEKAEESHRNGIVVVPQELAVLMSPQTTSVSQLCRVCLTKDTYLESLFSMSSNSAHEKTPADILSCIANVKPSYGDGLPENVCKRCICQIDNFFAFKQQCEKSEAVLQKFFSHGNVHKLNLDSTGEIAFVDTKTVDCHPEKHENETDASLPTGIYFDVDFQNSMSPDNLNNKDNLKWENSDSHNISNSCQLDVLKDENSTSGKLKLREKPIKKRKLKGKTIKRETKNDTDYESNSYCLNVYNEDTEIKESSTKTSEKKKSSIDSFICRWCGKQFPSQHRLNRHERIHQIEKLYNCDICKKGFNELRNYRRHLTRHKKLEENVEDVTCFPCSDCHMKFSSEMDLQIHSSIHVVSGNKRVCQHCKKEFETTVQLKRHVRIHMIDKPHKCSVCQKGFPEMGSLTRHFRRHTGEIRERKHICKFCNKAYYDRHSLNIHERKHTGVKPWKCLECGKRFIDSRLLNSHLKTHSDIKPYACDMCDKSFRHESTLTTHKRIHTGEKPYVCSVCGNAFVQSSNLSLHMRTHTRERPYSCEFCVKRFSSSSALTTHVRTHTGEKPYVCTICCKRFARYDMRAHMRTHTGEKPYVCTVCDRRFITPGQLQQHIRIHTGERPFTCTVCGKGCTTSCYLKRHMARTHNMMTVTPNIPSVIESKIESVESTEECVLTEIEEKSENIVISTGQVLNITPNTVTLSANNLNVVTVDNSNAQLNGLGISTCMSASEHEMVSAEVNVGTIVTDALITDDKLYQIDPSLIRIHHVSTANLIHSGQITLSTITDTSH